MRLSHESIANEYDLNRRFAARDSQRMAKGIEEHTEVLLKHFGPQARAPSAQK